MYSPRQPHLEVAHRVLRYINGTPRQGILLPSHESLTLQAYSDVDWARCPTTRKLTTGYVIFLGSSPITWRSKKQTIVSRSSAEVEYRVTANTTCKIIWFLI